MWLIYRFDYKNEKLFFTSMPNVGWSSFFPEIFTDLDIEGALSVIRELGIQLNDLKFVKIGSDNDLTIHQMDSLYTQV